MDVLTQIDGEPAVALRGMKNLVTLIVFAALPFANASTSCALLSNVGLANVLIFAFLIIV